MVRFKDKKTISKDSLTDSDIIPITDMEDNAQDKKVTIGQLKEYFAGGVATTDRLGLVKVDGTTISVLEDGTISNVGGSWGTITGELKDQKDLQTALNAKQDKLTAGEGILIEDNTIYNTKTSVNWGSVEGEIENQIDLKNKFDIQNMYETKNVSTDPKGYQQLLNMKESALIGSTYNSSKFEILNNAVQVTEEGVASGFTSDYNLQLVSDEINLKQNINIRLKVSVTFLKDQVAATVDQFITSVFGRLGIDSTTGKFFIGKNSYNLGALHGTFVAQEGDELDLLLTADVNKNVSLSISTDGGTNWTPDIQGTFDTSYATWAGSGIPFALGRGDTGNPWLGTIDLSKLTVDIDGVNVFNGSSPVYKTGIDTITINNETVEIPYILSKTGSKIADVAYRDKVQELYAQNGYAPYYTIDETNQNFTLPMGEIYGMIASVNTNADDKVSKSGDTMTGDLTIVSPRATVYSQSTQLELGAIPESTVYGGRLLMRDKNGKATVAIQNATAADGTNVLQMITRYPDDSAWGASIELGSKNGAPYISMPTNQKSQITTWGFPNYGKAVKKKGATVYQATTNVWVRVQNHTNLGGGQGFLYAGTTSSPTTKVCRWGGNVASGEWIFYPIPKGWYYKADTNGLDGLTEFPCAGEV